MLSFEGGALRFHALRCTQCGACLAACRNGALSLGAGDNGMFRVTWARDACAKCKQCVRVCPAADLPTHPLRESEWEKCPGAWLGRARIPQLCFAGSSGGVARTLIRHCLESGYCDAAWCVIRDSRGDARGALLRPGDDLGLISASEYRPIPVLAGLPRLSRGIRILLVGTNCQLQAAKRFFEGSGVHLTTVAVLCKQQKTLVFTDFVRRMLHAPDTEQVYYRGNGWPGEVRAGSSRASFAALASLPFGKGLWRVPGCRICPNPLGHDADITLTDPWKILNERDGGAGATLIIVRSEQGQNLLRHADAELTLDPLPIEAAKGSIDWRGIQKKQARQAFYLKKPLPAGRRLLYSLGEFQRKTYEAILERFCLPMVVLRILNRAPFLG